MDGDFFMDPFELPEQSLLSLEKLIGMRITIIDNDGIFNFKQRRMVFSPDRASHKKNEVCRCGFSQKCIEHCRFEMNRRCMQEESPFLSSCWKGIVQIVVPLRTASLHYGMLYAGCFRNSEAVLPEGLPKEFIPIYEALPVLEKEKVQTLFPLLQIQAEGMISYLRAANIVNDSYDLRKLRITEYIEQNLKRSIGLPDLARHLNLSESHTSVLVRKLLGWSFSEYLILRRVERVAQFLSTSDLSLREAADLCGFSSEFHLSRMFKRVKGISPSLFRKKFLCGADG